MAISAERITVSTVALALNPAETDSVSGGRGIVRNTNTAAADTLSLGDSSVAAATGYLLAGGSSIELQLGSGDRLFGVRATTADVVVHVLRVG
jgi:hypothetical protein